MNNSFLLFYSPAPRSQAGILIHRNWSIELMKFTYWQQKTKLVRFLPFSFNFMVVGSNSSGACSGYKG